MEAAVIPQRIPDLQAKVAFLCRATSYPDTNRVEALETHMSWVFLTDRYVYKLKKPVHYDFLDFSRPEARYKYCNEEVLINQALAGDTYLGVVPLNFRNGLIQINGSGKAIDWLVKMKRLPEALMLHNLIKQGCVPQSKVQQAADKLVNFYLHASPIRTSEHLNLMVKELEHNCTELLRNEFDLPHSLVISIETDLLRYVIKHGELLAQRMEEGRIIDAHGDLRPEHICLEQVPLIIDRVEFNQNLRIMDAADELSCLALECQMLGSPATGQLFLNIYRWKTHDRVPDSLISFYKAKRAFLRAKLSIHHLLESQYQPEEAKWRCLCNAYLQVAACYCEQVAKAC